MLPRCCARHNTGTGGLGTPSPSSLAELLAAAAAAAGALAAAAARALATTTTIAAARAALLALAVAHAGAVRAVIAAATTDAALIALVGRLDVVLHPLRRALDPRVDILLELVDLAGRRDRDGHALLVGLRGRGRAFRHVHRAHPDATAVTALLIVHRTRGTRRDLVLQQLVAALLDRRDRILVIRADRDDHRLAGQLRGRLRAEHGARAIAGLVAHRLVRRAGPHARAHRGRARAHVGTHRRARAHHCRAGARAHVGADHRRARPHRRRRPRTRRRRLRLLAASCEERQANDHACEATHGVVFITRCGGVSGL